MLIGGILSYVFREKVTQTTRQEMHTSMKFYGSRGTATQSWDVAQEYFKCCGVESYRDWQGQIPKSCCKPSVGNQKLPCQDFPLPANMWTNGCLDITISYVRDNAAIIGGAGIIVAILLVLGMIFSCSLFKMIE
jgi:tetraspanin-11